MRLAFCKVKIPHAAICGSTYECVLLPLKITGTACELTVTLQKVCRVPVPSGTAADTRGIKVSGDCFCCINDAAVRGKYSTVKIATLCLVMQFLLKFKGSTPSEAIYYVDFCLVTVENVERWPIAIGDMKMRLIRPAVYLGTIHLSCFCSHGAEGVDNGESRSSELNSTCRLCSASSTKDHLKGRNSVVIEDALKLFYDRLLISGFS